jgi:hypothetical protein
MTAKELLIQEAPRWTEHDAEVALRAVEHEREDPMIAAFRDAPEDDEPLTAEEEATLEQSHEEYRRGEGVPLDEIRHDTSCRADMPTTAEPANLKDRAVVQTRALMLNALWTG